MKILLLTEAEVKVQPVPDCMNWIISLIIGGIVGWLASIVMKTNAQMGLIANVLAGVVGAALLIFILGKLGIFRKQ